MSEPIGNTEQLPVAYRYDFDGYGYQYIDSGSGSDWKTRAKDAEPLYTKQPTNAEPVTWATEDLEDVMSPRFRQMHKDIKSSTWKQFPIPLYAHPPMRELTDEEIDNVLAPFMKYNFHHCGKTSYVIPNVDYQKFARAILKKASEK